MNEARLQRIIDRFHATSAQQWVLRALIVAAPVGAIAAANLAIDRAWPAGLVGVAVLAALSAVKPDDHLATVVVVIVVWHWLATVDDVGTPWLPVAAACLLAYHALVALSASVPIGGVVPAATVQVWLRRTTLTGAATVALWVCVVALDNRDATGNALLTGIALVIVTGGAAAMRAVGLGWRRAVAPDDASS